MTQLNQENFGVAKSYRNQSRTIVQYWVGKLITVNNIFRSRLFFATAFSLLCFTNNATASVGKWLFETNRSMEAFIAGLEEETIEVDGEKWLYYVKSTTLKSAATNHSKNDSCTVLLHGFTAEASHWFRFSRKAEYDNCVIIPDLPGFGRSTYSIETDYSITAQVNRLQRFLAKLQLADSYHFAGSSMGGQIAGMYSLRFPHEIASLTLINPGGVLSPYQSKMDIQVDRTGKSIFEVENIEEFRAMIDMTMADPPWMPDIVKKHLGKEAIRRTKRYRAMFTQVYKSINPES